MTDAEWADRDLATDGPTGRLDSKEARFPRLCAGDGLEEGGQMGGGIGPCLGFGVRGGRRHLDRAHGNTKGGAEIPTKDRCLPDNQIQKIARQRFNSLIRVSCFFCLLSPLLDPRCFNCTESRAVSFLPVLLVPILTANTPKFVAG